jgi:hypothetical protein
VSALKNLTERQPMTARPPGVDLRAAGKGGDEAVAFLVVPGNELAFVAHWAESLAMLFGSALVGSVAGSREKISVIHFTGSCPGCA